MIVEHLAMAERHVSEGLAHVERQKRIIADLERDGHDAGEARALLESFVELQELHEQDRDRLRRELSQHDTQNALKS